MKKDRNSVKLIASSTTLLGALLIYSPAYSTSVQPVPGAGAEIQDSTNRASPASASQKTRPRSNALEKFIRSRIGDDHRVEIRFGELPNGTKLKPCQKIEPFMANGTRLWGRTTIGVRCVSGARWSIALPVTVRVFGKVLVATQNLSARTSLTSSDVTFAEVELSRQAGKPLIDVAAIDGQMTTRPIRVGQPLMRHHVKMAPTISAGDPVRVIVQGQGFAVTSTGSALGAGSEGQPLRVRTAAGKVLVGTLKGRTIEIAL